MKLANQPQFFPDRNRVPGTGAAPKNWFSSRWQG